MLRKDLVETIRAVHGGKKKIPAEIAVEWAGHHTDDALTEREIVVLRQVASGNADKILADNLDISEETVKLTCGKFSPSSAPTIEPTQQPWR